MSNTLVIQVDIKIKGAKVPSSKNTFSYHEELYKLSRQSVKSWADRNGFDYLVIKNDDKLPGYHPAFQRVSLFHDDFKKYDNVVYADCDYVMHKLTPNIIEWTDERNESFFATQGNSSAPSITWNKKFNSGFFVIKRELIDKLKDKYVKYLEKHVKSAYKDEDMLNDLMKNHYKGYCMLSKHWNGILAVSSPLFCTHYTALRKEEFTKTKHDKWQREKIQKVAALSKEEIINRYLDHADLGGRIESNR